jgi:hypothetical protein
MRTAPWSCTPPRCRLRPDLIHVYSLHLLEMLAWKSTLSLSIPYQPTVLTGDKMYKRIWACNSVFTQIRPIANGHVRLSDRLSHPYRTSLPSCPSFMTTLRGAGAAFSRRSLCKNIKNHVRAMVGSNLIINPKK